VRVTPPAARTASARPPAAPPPAWTSASLARQEFFGRIGVPENLSPVPGGQIGVGRQRTAHWKRLVGQALRLAGQARDAGDRPLARALLRDFERHYPGDPSALRAQRLAGELTR
jgi:hypothetical protein